MGVGFLSFEENEWQGSGKVRVTNADGRLTVRVHYDDGVTQLICADQLSIPLPPEPAAAKLQVANQLKKLIVGPQDLEPDQITIEWTAAKA